MRRYPVVAGTLTIGALVIVAAFFLGRFTAPSHASSSVGDYFDGLRVGEAQGREQGRALQFGSGLRANDAKPVQDAFRAGYTAGANDVFAGYDGGWQLGVPWLITLEPGSGQIVYRIKGRTPLQPGMNYYLCPDGHTLCTQRR